MITLLENTQTRNKGTLNFVDHRGKVIGFNPDPDGVRLRYELRGPSGKTVLTEKDMPLAHYLRGLTCHFGPGISFTLDEDGQRNAMIVPLVSDTAIAGRGLQETQLRIAGTGGEYYCEDLGLSPEDIAKLFAEKQIVGARKIAVDGRLCLLEDRIAKLEKRLAELEQAARR